MWWLFLLIGFIAAVGVGVAVSKVRKVARAMNSLGIDGMEMMKRAEDKSIVGYANKKFDEKVQLFKLRIMKLLREREAAETDEQEKKFWQKAGELLNGRKASWGLVRKTAVPDGRVARILWRLGWGEGESELSLEITALHEYRTGKYEERCVVCDVPEDIITAVEELEMCQEAIR